MAKDRYLEQVNMPLLQQLQPTAIDGVQYVEEAELDEMWSFVGNKKQQRWLWHGIDHQTGQILAYVLAEHKDEAFIQLKALLEPLFGIQQFSQMVGALTNATWSRNSMLLAKVTLKRLSASI